MTSLLHKASTLYLCLFASASIRLQLKHPFIYLVQRQDMPTLISISISTRNLKSRMTTQVLIPASSMPLPCASPAVMISSSTQSSSVSTSYSNSGSLEGGREHEVSILDLLVDVIRKSLITGCGTSVVDESWAMEIGSPTNVRHVAHVTFDNFDGFLGLPAELQPEIPSRPLSASVSVFGVKTESMQLSFDQKGNSVPTILLMMQQRLYTLGGLQAEGIFRINGENVQEEFVRDQLNNSVIPDRVDVHCLAGLIKSWFRELPTGILDSLSPEEVLQSQTKEQCLRLVKRLPSTEYALLDWALELMADVVQLEHLNKMNAYNVAVVFAPNMTQMADPLTALMHAVQLTKFLKLLIETKVEERQESLLDYHQRHDSPGNNEPKSPSCSDKSANKTNVTSTENAPPDGHFSSPGVIKVSDCHIGQTEKSPSNKAGSRTHSTGQSYKPHSKRGSRAVNEKQLRTNSRPKKSEAWR